MARGGWRSVGVSPATDQYPHSAWSISLKPKPKYTRLVAASGERGKKRPVVVIQVDSYNRRLRHAVVAEVTGNLDARTAAARNRRAPTFPGPTDAAVFARNARPCAFGNGAKSLT